MERVAEPDTSLQQLRQLDSMNSIDPTFTSGSNRRLSRAANCKAHKMKTRLFTSWIQGSRIRRNWTAPSLSTTEVSGPWLPFRHRRRTFTAQCHSHLSLWRLTWKWRVLHTVIHTHPYSHYRLISANLDNRLARPNRASRPCLLHLFQSSLPRPTIMSSTSFSTACRLWRHAHLDCVT